LIIKPILYSKKELKLTLTMNITSKLNYFFTISKNKSNYKYFTSIKGVLKYLDEININQFFLGLIRVMS